MKNEYTLPMDRVTKTITVFSLILGALIPLILLVTTKILWITLVLAIFIFFTYFIAFLFTPLKVLVTENGIKIKRRLKDIFIPFSEIKKIQVVDLRLRGVRLFGVGGLFGFFGLFYIERVGKIWVYSRSRNKLVVIETMKGKTGLGINESEIEKFIENMKEFLER